MVIKQLKLGPMDNFSYILWNSGEGEAAVIDPAWEPEKIAAALREESLSPTLLLLTHAHPDHINAADYFLSRNKTLRITLHKEDSFLLEGSAWPLNFPEDGEELKLGSSSIKILHTPGHTPGSVSYLAGGAVFSGDTLFVGACGRADLPGSDPKALRRSLLRLAGLPGETVLYPGHAYNGDVSTIAVQKEYNVYMKLAARGEAEFLRSAV